MSSDPTEQAQWVSPWDRHPLTGGQRDLAEAMSDLSEEAWVAGWMSGTEYAIWRLLQEGGGT